jgi:hypothetical protein
MNTFTRIVVLGATLAGFSLAAQAAAPSQDWILEQAIEASATSVALPATARGTLVVTPCVGCVPKSLLVSPRTQYRAVNGPVPLAALRKAFAVHPQAFLTVFYDSRTGVVTRVIADVAVLPEKRKP